MEGGGSSGGELVVKLEDAVPQLVEHLVTPVLPRGTLMRRGKDLAPEGQDTVARQVHATVLLYNYFHRRQFPRLDFAGPERFCECASTATGASLLGAYLNHNHCRGGDAGGDDDAEGEPSVTYKAIVDACGIAEALDATADSPHMTTWPISKVAVLLVDGTRTRCLIERGAVTKGVWSIFEKELGDSRESNVSVRRSKRNAAHQDSEPYMLQQTAYSEVERKTGLKRSDLRVLEEHLVYSLSKKGTSTKLFVLQYDQTMNKSKSLEMPLNDLIDRMTGPILKNDPGPTTTCVVNYYHILPYEKVLLDLLNRELSPEYPLNVPKEKPRRNGKSFWHSEIDGSLKEQEVNSKPKMARTTTTISALKKNKRVVKEVGNSGTNNCSTKQTISALKSEVGKRPRKENDSPDLPVEEKLKSVSNPVNAKAKEAACAGIVELAGVQIDKSGTKKHSVSRNMTQDISRVKALEVDTVMVKHASESQNEKVTEKSGGITVSMYDQMCALLQSLQKMRDNTVREHRMLADRCAQLDMDIQTILSEGGMTPKVMSIIKRHEDIAHSTCSGEGCQTISIQRKRLKEAILRNKCQELDDICRDNNWIPPRYEVLPSVIDEKYRAMVYLSGPDFDLSADGGMRTNPHEARDSAASNMIHQIQQKANEN